MTTPVLDYHPFSRAAGVVFMLEDVGVPYELRFIDFNANENRGAELMRINPMGKLPTLVDGDAVVTEAARRAARGPISQKVYSVQYT